MKEQKSNNGSQPALQQTDVRGSICPKCGFVGTEKEPVYTETELMYENDIDDPAIWWSIGRGRDFPLSKLWRLILPLTLN